MAEILDNMDDFDQLPPVLRYVLAECPIKYNATTILAQLRQGYTTGQIITSLQSDLKSLGIKWNPWGCASCQN